MPPRADVAPLFAELARARRVAILRLGSIGDVVETLPIAWLLRDLLGPTPEFCWLTHAESAPLLERVAAIDRVVVVPRSRILTSAPRWRRAAGGAPDVLLDLHGNLKSALVGLLSGARVRVGFHPADCRERWNALGTNRRLPRLASRHKARRALEVAQLLGHEAPAPRFDFRFTAEEEARADRVLAALDRVEEPVALLQLGRPGDVRSWPLARYAELARALLAAGRCVIVTGGPAEIEVGDELRRELDGADGCRLRFELGSLSLGELGALLQRLAADRGRPHVFVGPDSGPLHLADACGLRSIGLFGPQDPAKQAPLGERTEVIHHAAAAPCIPCERRECVHPVRAFCMQDISVREVARRIDHPEPRPPFRATAPASNGAAAATRRAPARWLAWAHELTPWRWLLVVAPLLLAWLGNGTLLERAHAAVAAAATVLLTTSLARRLGNDRTALLAGIVLLSMWRPWSLDRPLVDLDGAALVIASLYFYVEADRPISRLGDWAYLLSAAAAGAAAHEAGIAGALLPLLGIVVFHAGERTLRRLLRPTVVASLLFAAAFPTLLRATLGERGVTGADPPSFRTCSRWILVGVLPVAIVLPFVLFDHFKVRGFREDHGFADRAWRFPKAALVAALVLLVAAPTSREIGGLAVLPMLALLVASWFDRLWRRRA